MKRHTSRLIMAGSALAFVASLANAGQDLITVKDLNPFTHVVRIPTGADLSSIRFEQAKLVTVPTRGMSVENASYCGELAFSDPGGSMYCPSGAWQRKDTRCHEIVTYKTVTSPSEYVTIRIGLSGMERAVTATAQASGRR